MDTMAATLQRLETARKYQDLGLSLPGPFARPQRPLSVPSSSASTASSSVVAGGSMEDVPDSEDIYEYLLPRLVASLVSRAEETLEQLRLCVEELEVVSKQLESFAASDESFRSTAYWHAQEFLRKKQLLEAALLPDGSDRFSDLQVAWNSNSSVP